jgi:hypothetical protein
VKRLALALALAACASVTGCSRTGLIDVVMHGAARPDPAPFETFDRYLLLAGDTHCHVSPPDVPWHASRDFGETARLAAREGLDFVILTPHIASRFWESAEGREDVVAAQRALTSEIAATPSQTIFIPGFEYTDYAFGHVGLSFADVSAALADVSVEESRRAPERFFASWNAHGGLVTINHPVLRPIPHAGFAPARADLSWRAFEGKPVPPEVRWVSEHAQSIEVFNLDLSHLRDQFALGDRDRSLREAAHLAERESRRTGRRITHVGGSDSHGDHMRAVTFLLARERSAAGVRAAILAGRACVRAAEACTLQVRSSPGAPWHNVGDAVPRSGDAVEARASGGDVTFLVDGVVAARAPSEAVTRVPVPAWRRCAQVRAIVGESWSSPVYVGACSERPARADDGRAGRAHDPG